jgi:hypothetical protein
VTTRGGEWVDGLEQERRIIKAALEQGYTKLEARLLGLAERRGGVNFQTARECAKELDGVKHAADVKLGRRESVSRAWRNIAHKGGVLLKRIYTGGRMPRAKWRSAHGSTVKDVQHRAFGLKNPWTRAERRRRQIEHAKAARRAEIDAQYREEQDFTSHCPTPRTATTLLQDLDPDLGDVIAEARLAHERLDERRAAAGRTGRAPVPPAAAVRGPPQ